MAAESTDPIKVTTAINSLIVEWWPIDRPKPYPKNARKLSPRAIDVLAACLREYGWQQPIVVDMEGVIVVGHTRLMAAKKLGMTEVPVHVASNLTPEQAKAYRLMDNRSAQETAFDLDLLSAELLDRKGLNIDLGLTGFEMVEIDRMLSKAGIAAGLTDEDAVPDVPATPVTMRGDLWLLGDHRVLCGDSTNGDAVGRLMDGEKADLVFTDPPYNVDYQGYTEEKLTIQSDKMSAADFKTFLRDVFASYYGAVKQTVAMYVCHPSSWQREFQDALEAAGFKLRTQIIWAKNTFAWGFARYKFQHEPIFYCYLAGQSDPWFGDKSQLTLWQQNKPAASRLHPTMKPVELVERAVVNSSRLGDIVLDLFGGSGSTLIAAAKNGRKCRLMELDPKYVDVIVRRWQEFTGKDAVLDSTGKTFNATRAERIGVTMRVPDPAAA